MKKVVKYDEIVPASGFAGTSETTKEETYKIVEDMLLTMKGTDSVALSSNMIGYNSRICIVGSVYDLENIIILLNPRIMKTEGRTIIDEICPMFGNRVIKVVRPSSILVKYNTVTGEEVLKQYSGITASCIVRTVQALDGKTLKDTATSEAIEHSLKLSVDIG